MKKNDEKGLYFSNIHNNLDYDGFDYKDVIIVICSSSQLELLRKYGKEYVLLDSTYGVCESKLKMKALMVVNEFGVGNSAASFITVKTNAEKWKECLIYLKTPLGGDVVSPKVFMTDDDSSYYNAWTAVMGEPQKRLICTWHVGQSWKRKLGKLRFTALDQKDLLSKLISIKSALTQKAYNRRKNSLIKALTEEDEESLVEMKQRRQAVLKYLPTYYFTQERELIWANCHRCGLGLTIDNYAESFFNVLKNAYSIKNNHRLHALVHVLCNKAYDDSKKYLEKC